MERSQSEGMGRREFIGAAAAALFAGVVITVTGCSEDEPTGPGDGGKAGQVESASGHTHSVSITKAQLDAEGAVTLTLSETGGHTHELALTADNVKAIKAGHFTAPSTSVNSHQHTVHFT